MDVLRCLSLIIFITLGTDLCAVPPQDILVREQNSSGREKLLSLIAGEWIAQSIYAAAELDIASYLRKGPQSAQKLAELSQSNEESLYRLLRMLASVGIFHEEEGRIFSNTPTSELLAKDHPQSLRELTLFYSHEMSESLRQVASCVKEGTPAFELTFEQPVFTFFREHPQAAVRFNTAMREKSKAVITSCLQFFDFSAYHSVCDIGGGVGHFLSALLGKYSHMHGILYELPEVITVAKDTGHAVASRCTFTSGDFFQQIPADADAYLLKSVLHDWNDSDACRILKQCHMAMRDQAKLLVIEPIITIRNQKEAAKEMDVFMMAITGGKERTLQDFIRLFDETGFSIVSLTPTETEFTIIEVRKVISSNPG